MTDYAEEQANELEALLSIFPDEFSMINEGPPAEFQLLVVPDPDILSDADGNSIPVTFSLQITYTDTYPDTPPEVILVDVDGLLESEEKELLAALDGVAEESIGMAMGFALASAAKDTAESLLTARAEKEAAETAARIEREEEADRQRHAGTRVTPESFAAWSAAFLAEITAIIRSGKSDALTPAQRAAAAVAGLLDPVRGTAVKGKQATLTGRQLFEKDRSLAQSDLAHHEEGDVAVDAELFEGMDDLDLEEEDEEENSVLANIRAGGDDD
ncbi:RWD domain-containing protein 1 [Thoreauomyces humboldtii]|nr:RWD domain-containing protein 1 [Thoreauomyces humboldtii]